MHRLLLLGALLGAPLLLALAAAPAAQAQDCNACTPIEWSPPGHTGDEPVWRMCWVRPRNSSGPAGSGLEVRDVYHHGRLVMKRGHVPIVNVQYETGCSCYRDWADEEVRFEATGAVSACHAETSPGEVRTACDSGNGADVGNFTGVSAERYDDRLVLTSQVKAGWYRYPMTWTFHADGRIRPEFQFATVQSPCIMNPRRHHAYWRFDFDIDGADMDYVTESGTVRGDTVLAVETMRTWAAAPGRTSWAVRDRETGRGYTVVPGDKDLALPADNFSKADAIVLRYQPNQFNDGQPEFGSCSIVFEEGSDPAINGEPTVDTDVVLFYRNGYFNPGEDDTSGPFRCERVGPTLYPIGTWEPQVVGGEAAATPAGFILEAVYPNPFDRTTQVRFRVDEAQHVSVRVYDSVGRQVLDLFDAAAPAGAFQTVTLDGTDLPSGVYTVRLTSERGLEGTTRAVLLK